MKKLMLSAFAILCFANVFGQAREEINFGLIGINYEIPIHKDITIAPGIGTNLDLDWLNIGVKGNYYFDNLFGISDNAWDVYGGLNLGYAVYMGDHDHDNDGPDHHGHDHDDYDNGLNLGLQIGGRWFWNDKWGVYAEIASGSISGMSPAIGVTMKL